MKRNLCLVRKVLEHVEAQDSTDLCRPPELPHFTPEEVCEHARLCYEADYLRDFQEVRRGDGAQRRVAVCLLGPLTWAGHDALRDLRADPHA